MKSYKIILTSFVITAAVIKGTAALAEPVEPQNVSVVQTSDLDLSTAAGRASLDHRLVRAAYDVCDSASDVDLAGKNAVSACRAEVLARARFQGDRLADRAHAVVVASGR